MGKYRLITTLGSSEKQMWFFKRNKCCGVKVPHGTMILLSKEGGGVNESSKIIHAVKNEECSAIEYLPKSNGHSLQAGAGQIDTKQLCAQSTAISALMSTFKPSKCASSIF